MMHYQFQAKLYVCVIVYTISPPHPQQATPHRSRRKRGAISHCFFLLTAPTTPIKVSLLSCIPPLLRALSFNTGFQILPFNTQQQETQLSSFSAPTSPPPAAAPQPPVWKKFSKFKPHSTKLKMAQKGKQTTLCWAPVRFHRHELPFFLSLCSQIILRS